MFFNLLDAERLIHSFKTLIACLIGVGIIRLFHITSGQWIVVTICVVMCSQLYVGSVIQKGYLRFLGTLIGCLMAIAALLLAPNIHIAALSAIAISVFFFSYLATMQESFSAMGTLGAVTTIIIMLGTLPPSITVAAERFLEISVGIFIATLVSQFIFPVHARTHLRKAQAKTLAQLRDYYIEITSPDNETRRKDYSEIDETIGKSLMRQRQLAKESAREPLGISFNPAHFSQTLACEREILRAITFMQNALQNIQQIRDVYFTSPAALTFNKQITQGLNDLIQAIEKDKHSGSHILIPPLYPIQAAIQQCSTSATREEQIYVNGFLFSTEVLTRGLARLADLYLLKTVKASE